MNYTAKIWWDKLRKREKELLIEMLFEMDLSVFEDYGIILDMTKNEYIKDKETEEEEKERLFKIRHEGIK